MVPLYQDSGFTFRFAEDRLIPRFHLEGVPAGQGVAVFKLDPATGKQRDLLTRGMAGTGGWVELAAPIRVKAGEAFIAVLARPPLIRPETVADHGAIRQVNQLAFGQNAEARLVDELRAGGHVRASLVAAVDARLVGHILFSDLPIITETGMVPALALAPLAVLPAYQNQGIGSALVDRGLEVCRDQGHRIVVVLGHPQYYPRFGFSARLAESLASPFDGGESFMAAELVAGALDGVRGRVEYAPPFAAFT